MQLGNGRWETAEYNSRQQVKMIGLGVTGEDQGLLKLEYKYDTSGNHDNNGSMNLGDPQSFNRYAYVQGQPTNFVDPSGLLRIQQCTKYWWYDGNGDYHSIITGCETIYDDGSGNQIVSSAYDLAKDLVRNPECAKLFGGSKKASETLSKMQKNTMISSTHPPINFNPSGSRGYSGIGVPFINVVAWTATWSWNKKSYGSVFIDPNGQFFQPSDRTIAQGSDILVDSNIFNAIVILHEMKHWNRNTSVSKHTAVWNTDLYNKCVRKNAMLGTDPSAGPNSTSA